MDYFENLTVLEELFVKEHHNYIKILLDLVSQGDAKSENNLGILYLDNAPSQRFQEEGIRLLKLAAEHGNEFAKSSLKLHVTDGSVYDQVHTKIEKDHDDPYDINIDENNLIDDGSETVSQLTRVRFCVRQTREGLVYVLSLILLLVIAGYVLLFLSQHWHVIGYITASLGIVYALIILAPLTRTYDIEISDDTVKLIHGGKVSVFSRSKITGIHLTGRTYHISYNDHHNIYHIRSIVRQPMLEDINAKTKSFMKSYPLVFSHDMSVTDIMRMIEVSSAGTGIKTRKLATYLANNLTRGELINFVMRFTLVNRLVILIFVWLVILSIPIGGLIIALIFRYLFEYYSKRYIICTSRDILELTGTFDVIHKIPINSIIELTVFDNGIKITTNNETVFLKIKLTNNKAQTMLSKVLSDTVCL